MSCKGRRPNYREHRQLGFPCEKQRGSVCLSISRIDLGLGLGLANACLWALCAAEAILHTFGIGQISSMVNYTLIVYVPSCNQV